MPRLFTGLELPAAVVRQLALMRGGVVGARWLEPEDYHITLRFIGDIDAGAARDIDETLRDDIGLNRLGFPNRAYSDSPCWLGRRPVWMGKPYSMDLRERAVAAVLKEGLSRHESAARFGVAPSTVINWMRRFRETGSVAPGQMGGHKPKAIAGEHAAFLARRVWDGAFTLRGLVAELAERGLKVDYRSVWNFVHAEELSFKKNRRRQRARSA